jgi:hypothetical protein
MFRLRVFVYIDRNIMMPKQFHIGFVAFVIVYPEVNWSWGKWLMLRFHLTNATIKSSLRSAMLEKVCATKWTHLCKVIQINSWIKLTNYVQYNIINCVPGKHQTLQQITLYLLMKVSVSHPAMAVVIPNGIIQTWSTESWTVSTVCEKIKYTCDKITDYQYQYGSFVLNPSYLIAFYIAAGT